MKIFNLFESAVNEDELITLCKGDYSEAFARGLDGYFIFKGLSGAVVTTEILKLSPIENRKSANTKNYYTLWINNSEQWADFPDRAVISSTSPTYALTYGRVFVLLPKNGTNIGICPANDFWVSFDAYYPPDTINNETHLLLSNAEIVTKEPKTYEELLSAFEQFDSLDVNVKSELISEYSALPIEFAKVIINEGLQKFYNRYYHTTDFNLQSIKSFNEVNNREVWFDADFIAIEKSFAENFFTNARRYGI